MRHITPKGMGEHDLGPFLPIPGTYPGVQGAKNVFFFMAGLLQVRPAHIRKCSRLYCPITYFPEDPFNQTSQTWRWGCPKYGYFVDKNQAVVDKCGHLGGNNRLLWQEGSRVG